MSGSRRRGGNPFGTRPRARVGEPVPVMTHPKWFTHPPAYYDAMARKNQGVETVALLYGKRIIQPAMQRFFPGSKVGKMALELGSGQAPQTLSHGYSRVFLLDLSPAWNRAARKQLRGELPAKVLEPLPIHPQTQVHHVTADMRQLPFAESQRFHMTTVIESLTHIPPGDREALIKDIAGRSDNIFVLDRFTGTLSEDGQELSYEPGLVRQYPEFVDGNKLHDALADAGFDTNYLAFAVDMINNKGERVLQPFFMLAGRRKRAPSRLAQSISRLRGLFTRRQAPT